MYFSGGIISTFMVFHWLGLYDTYLVYILPFLFSGFYNVIIFNANFKAIPDSLFEAAKIDGASEYKIFLQIVLPLSKPVMAALGVFTACGIWNDYGTTLFFTQSTSLQTLANYTLKVVKSSQAAEQLKSVAMQSSSQVADLVNAAQGTGAITAQTVELSAMVLTAIPMIIMYPFVQRFFTKGVMVGSVKG
jgi:putative aldouronate transport system permease protein